MLSILASHYLLTQALLYNTSFLGRCRQAMHGCNWCSRGHGGVRTQRREIRAIGDDFMSRGPAEWKQSSGLITCSRDSAAALLYDLVEEINCTEQARRGLRTQPCINLPRDTTLHFTSSTLASCLRLPNPHHHAFSPTLMKDDSHVHISARRRPPCRCDTRGMHECADLTRRLAESSVLGSDVNQLATRAETRGLIRNPPGSIRLRRGILPLADFAGPSLFPRPTTDFGLSIQCLWRIFAEIGTLESLERAPNCLIRSYVFGQSPTIQRVESDAYLFSAFFSHISFYCENTSL